MLGKRLNDINEYRNVCEKEGQEPIKKILEDRLMKGQIDKLDIYRSSVIDPRNKGQQTQVTKPSRIRKKCNNLWKSFKNCWRVKQKYQQLEQNMGSKISQIELYQQSFVIKQLEK
jgi:hypothetical protein